MKTTSLSSDNERLFYTVDEIHKKRIIPLGKNKLYELVHRADFPKIAVGRTILIPVEGLHEWTRSKWSDVKSQY